MKRILSFLLAALLALTLCACDVGRGAATGSDLTQADIDRILAEMETAETAEP